MHHALMNLCEPVLERAAIFDSYACRQGKGQLAAVRRAESYARRYGWFLKMDVRKYFLGYRVFPQELRLARRSKLRREFRGGLPRPSGRSRGFSSNGTENCSLALWFEPPFERPALVLRLRHGFWNSFPFQKGLQHESVHVDHAVLQ